MFCLAYKNLRSVIRKRRFIYKRQNKFIMNRKQFV